MRRLSPLWGHTFLMYVERVIFLLSLSKKKDLRGKLETINREVPYPIQSSDSKKLNDINQWYVN